jgi:hypothetical protein
MKNIKAIVIEYKDGSEVGRQRYKSLAKAWMAAEKMNTTDPECISKHRYFQVVEVKKDKNAMDYIA